MTNTIRHTDGQIHQGDIYCDIDYIERADIVDGHVEISKIHFQYVLVLSQECDLTQDFLERKKEDLSLIKHDKLLQSVIVVPMFNFEHFRLGEHFSNLGFSMAKDFSKSTATATKILQQNNNPRYHYMEFRDETPIIPSVVDFKRFFTIDLAELYKKRDTNYICSLDVLFRERISQRFSDFLSRIGLPDGR